MKIRLEFKPQDCWVGVFWQWKRPQGTFTFYETLYIWICVVPMFPIHVTGRSRHTPTPDLSSLKWPLPKGDQPDA